MSDGKFTVDSILEELSSNRGLTYEKRAKLSRGETELFVDDILADTTREKKVGTIVDDTANEKKFDAVFADTPLPPIPKTDLNLVLKEEKQKGKKQEEKQKEKKQEKTPRKRKKKEQEEDLLATITPWHKRHEEKADAIPAKSGAKESQEFLSSLKNEKTQVVDPTTQLLAQSTEQVASKEASLSIPSAQKENGEEKQRDLDVSKKMETVYEPTRHVVATPRPISVNAGEKTIISGSVLPAPKTDEITGQVRLEGFETAEQSVPVNVVEDWEGEFLSNREEKINEFRMKKTAEEEEVPKTFEDDGDYHGLQDAPKVKFDLLARRRSVTLRMVVTLLVFVFTLLLTVVDNYDISSGVLADNPSLTLGLYGAGLLVCIVLNLRLLAGGLIALFRGGDQDTPAAIGFLLAAAQMIGIILLGNDVLKTSLFAGLIGCAAELGLLLNLLGKRVLFTRMYRNFELVGNSRMKQVVTPVENQDQAFELGRGLAIGSPTVAISRKAVHLDGYVYHSYAPDMTEVAARIPLLLLPLFGLIGGICAYLVLPDGNTAKTTLQILCGVCGCMQIALPVTTVLAGNLPFHWFGNHLRSQKIMMSGYDAVASLKDTDVLAVDAAELFPTGTISLKSIQSARNQSLDRSIMDVAGVVYMADSPLKPLFETIIQGKTNLLPEVDTLVYEEEMGISGWVMGHRVLVGTRQLMETHGITLPVIDYEDQYNESGLKPVYLSTGGTLSAVFLVQYTANPKVKVGLQRAVKDGMSIHVYSCDPNITQDLISKMFRIPAASVRIMGAVPRRLYKQQFEQKHIPQAELSYEGNAGTYFRGVCAAKKLYRVIRFAAILQTLFVILGALGFCAGIYLTSAGISGLMLLAYQLITTFFVVALPRLMGR